MANRSNSLRTKCRKFQKAASTIESLQKKLMKKGKRHTAEKLSADLQKKTWVLSKKTNPYVQTYPVKIIKLRKKGVMTSVVVTKKTTTKPIYERIFIYNPSISLE